jgi:hypothetical protein
MTDEFRPHEFVSLGVDDVPSLEDYERAQMNPTTKPLPVTPANTPMPRTHKISPEQHRMMYNRQHEVPAYMKHQTSETQLIICEPLISNAQHLRIPPIRFPGYDIAPLATGLLIEDPAATDVEPVAGTPTITTKKPNKR